MSSVAAHHPRLQHHFPNLAEQKNASIFGMWVFLVTEILFFGGLLGAYTVYRYLYYEAFQAGSLHLDIQLGAGNTAVLIVSSLTMAMAVHSAALGKKDATVAYILATMFFGTAFLGVKVYEYADKFEHHLVPGAHYSAESLHLPGHGDGGHAKPEDPDWQKHSQIFYSLYFCLTGLHATHMIIGMPIMLWLAWSANRGDFSPQWYTPVEIFGLYWHFVDIVWIFLFPLLYLIGRHH